MDRILLISTPLITWPARITQRSWRQLTLEDLEGDALPIAPESGLWMGYSSPLHCLQLALEQPGKADPLLILARWQQSAELFLQERSRHPGPTRLLQLPQLSTWALDQLLAAVDGQDSSPEPPSRESPHQSDTAAVRASPLAQLLISQRPDLQQLHADLERQADLFGREPQPELNLPSCSDPALGQALLHQWRRAGHQPWPREQRQGHAGALSGPLETDAQALQERCEALQEALRSAEANLAVEVRRSADVIAQTMEQHQELQEENELVLQQLRQLQEELSTTFASLQQSRATGREQAQRLLQLQQQNQTLAEELEQLAQECRYLFLHSQLLNGIDRHRIRRILQLVRQSLQH